MSSNIKKSEYCTEEQMGDKGSPAAAARALSDAELDYFRYTAGNYVKLKDQYISEGLGE